MEPRGGRNRGRIRCRSGSGRARGKARGVPHDVVLNHHLRFSGNEHVEARLSSREAELERTPSRIWYELEQAAALLRNLGKQSGISPKHEIFGIYAMSALGPLAGNPLPRNVW